MIEQQLSQLGVGAILAVIILEKSIGLIKWLIEKNKNGNGIKKVDSSQDSDIAVIKKQLSIYETNHFPTIDKRLDRIENKQDLLLEKIILILKK